MLNVGIFIYDQAEVLDFAGPFEVFSTANRLAVPAPFTVMLIAPQLALIRARGGFQIMPDYGIEQHPKLDIVIVVGGVHAEVMQQAAVLEWAQKVAATATIVASVCTGAFILAAAGLLTGQQVTTHWEDQADLARAYPELEVVGSRRWVDNGRFVTSGGISAGIDMSLHLVARVAGQALAARTAQQMEFDWQQTCGESTDAST